MLSWWLFVLLVTCVSLSHAHDDDDDDDDASKDLQGDRLKVFMERFHYCVGLSEDGEDSRSDLVDGFSYYKTWGASGHGELSYKPLVPTASAGCYEKTEGSFNYGCLVTDLKDGGTGRCSKSRTHLHGPKKESSHMDIVMKMSKHDELHCSVRVVVNKNLQLMLKLTDDDQPVFIVKKGNDYVEGTNNACHDLYEHFRDLLQLTLAVANNANPRDGMCPGDYSTKCSDEHYKRTEL